MTAERAGQAGPGPVRWATPDRRRAPLPSGPAPYGAPPPAADGPPWREDAAAAAVTVALVVLLGAPVGLLWSVLAPQVQIVVADGQVGLAQLETSAFIAADAWFLVLGLLAGLLSGAVAWWVGRRHGPGLAIGLLVGGLAAAWVARSVGEQVGLEALQDAVAAGQQGALELSLVLRADEAMVGWPVGALLGLLVPTWLVDRR